MKRASDAMSDEGERYYMYVFNFHLRPNRSVRIPLTVLVEHFRWEEIAGEWTFPAAASISIEGRKLADQIRLENLIGDQMMPAPLPVPFVCVKGEIIEISVENRSERTRKWNRGQIILTGYMWD
jgi:hypothetical protein